MVIKNVISVQVQKQDTAFSDQLSTYNGLTFTRLETSSFDGQSEIATLVITLTPMVLTFLGKVLTEHIRAKKYVKVIYKGVQIQGLSEKNVVEVIEKITTTRE